MTALPPRVSVIMPTYNQEAYVAEALDSILAQQYANLEIVVSDDASTDGTARVLRAYADRHPDVIRLILQPHNIGITPNINVCLSACTGKYIALFAGDDIMLPGKLRRQVEYLEAHDDCVMCYHNLDVFDSATGKTLRTFNCTTTADRFSPKRLWFGAKPEVPRQGGAEQLVAYGTFSGGCSILFSAEACPAVGADERIALASDWLLWIDIAVHGRIAYLNEVLGRYRRHTASITAATPPADITDQLQTLDVVDARYPHLRRYSSRHRARLLLRRGAHALRDGRVSHACGAFASAAGAYMRYLFPRRP